MRIWLGVVVAVLASATGGYWVGVSKGQDVGYDAASREYDFWSTSMMVRDPSLRLDGIILVGDGARIKVPSCDADEHLEALAWRRPEKGVISANNNPALQRNGDALVVSFPADNKNKFARAAAVIGCRKNEPQNIQSLEQSWEFPSNLR